jgi:DNA-binding transcriptional ArsR family regulator
MAKESFMLVSLKGDKAKKLAQVMANPTCTRILDYLAGKDATETQVAKELGIPISTVHYNLQQLVEAKLVVVDEFHYSEKGREVNHYKLANKYIIIAPQDDPSFLANLKKYLPVAIITAGAAVVLKTMQFMTGTTEAAIADDALATKAAPMAADAVPESAPEFTRIMADTASGAAEQSALRVMEFNETINDTMGEVINQGAEAFVSPEQIAVPAAPWWQSQAIDYFIAGALFVLFIFFIFELANYLRNKN